MTSPDRENLQFLILATLVSVGVLALLAVGYFTAQNNSEKQQRFQLACIEAGGSYIKDACINPTTPVTR